MLVVVHAIKIACESNSNSIPNDREIMAVNLYFVTVGPPTGARKRQNKGPAIISDI